MLNWQYNKKTEVWSGKHGKIEIANFKIKRYPPEEHIQWARIHSVWNTRQDLYCPHGEYYLEAKLNGEIVKLIIVNDIREYCEARFKSWLESANLEVKNGN
jgi:hypothetical protein